MTNSHNAFKTRLDGKTMVVMLQGDCLSTEESALEREIDSLHAQFDKAEVQNVLIDIGGAPFFGSIIIGAIVALCHKAVAGGGKAAMCDATGGMRDVIRIMKLDQVFPYYDTPEEATESLRSNG
jgi:anti-anti-sigma factor